MTRKIETTQAYVDSLEFYMMPEDGGQIVEVRYAVDGDGVWCWTHDRSDRTDSYRFASYNARANEADLEFEPQNSRLPRCNKWREVVIR